MVQLNLTPHNRARCAPIHGGAAVVAFAPISAARRLFVCAIPPCQTWRKGSFERLSAGAPHSSRTPSTNAPRATCATSASDAAPSATISAEPWVSAVLARTASSRFCSVTSWIWRCSPYWIPSHRPAPREPSTGEGHDALFAQGLDNPLWVAHMTHPTDYDYDGPPSTYIFPYPASPFSKRPWRSSKQPLGSQLCFVRCFLPGSSQFGNSSPRRRQI